MRLLIATDAWHPQVNGVVRSLEHMAAQAPAFGAEVCFLTPEGFRTVPMPELRRDPPGARRTRRGRGRHRGGFGADPCPHRDGGADRLCGAAACLREGGPSPRAITPASRNTVAARGAGPGRVDLRGCCGASTMRARHHGLDALAGRGTSRRGASGTSCAGPAASTRPVPPEGRSRPRRAAPDISLRRPRRGREEPRGLPVARPARHQDRRRRRAGAAAARGPHPDARFLGKLAGEALAEVYSSADVFVFPSLTDTFGIVLLEALASGLPIAAFPVTGPLDVVDEPDAAC